MPRARATRERSCAKAFTSSRARVAEGCSASTNDGPSASARASRTRPRTSRRRLGDPRRQLRFGQTDFARQRRDLRLEIGSDRIDLERERHRDVLLDRELRDEHRAIGEDADAVEHRQPGVAVGDVARRKAEQLDLARVGQQRAGERGRRTLRPPRHRARRC